MSLFEKKLTPKQIKVDEIKCRYERRNARTYGMLKTEKKVMKKFERARLCNGIAALLICLPRLIAVSILLLCGNNIVSLCRGDTNQEADQFKAFSSSHSPVKALTCRLDNLDPKGGIAFSYYLFLRVQSNALLLANSSAIESNVLSTRASSFFPENMPTDFKNGSVVSRFEDVYWYRFYTDSYIWRKEGQPDDGNVVIRHFQDALTSDCAKILNMGCDNVPAFSIVWQGDEFTQSNAISGFIVKGNLTRDNQGRAKALFVQLEKPGKAMTCRFDYVYDEAVPNAPFLPSKIIKQPLTGYGDNATAPVWELHFLGVQFSDTLMEEKAFSLSSNTNGVKNFFTVTNSQLVYTKNGSKITIPDTQSETAIMENKKRESKGKWRGKFVSAALVLLLVVPIVMIFKRRKDFAS